MYAQFFNARQSYFGFLQLMMAVSSLSLIKAAEANETQCVLA